MVAWATSAKCLIKIQTSLVLTLRALLYRTYGSHLIFTIQKAGDKHRLFVWRRGRDSNPRGGLLPPTGLANQPLQPLGYLSSS